MLFILQALYYFLPVYISNMVPVILKHLPLLAQPVDFNRTWHNKPIFGPNKTWRGLICGTLAGTLTFVFQQSMYDYSLSVFSKRRKSSHGKIRC